MTREEANEIVKLIYTVFTNMNFTKEKAKAWIDIVEKGNYQKTKRKLDNYIENNKYPPTISDFLVKDEYNPADDYKKKIERDKQIVQQEMNDPEKRKRREQNLKRMQKMMARLKAGDNDEQ
ncbi:hypothetical protein NK211_13005 [Mammaliicoccus sciuri]|uniref:hypothetical protein n=1 Tax=Mammaliicoccus sciuri TaxID=1296 RepID=UPI0020A2206E|nr:hypothetical protein [Mammaliicoccus sciuri]MCP1288297.1 hypothetical protein [Mammaliicoccus sciuri]